MSEVPAGVATPNASKLPGGVVLAGAVIAGVGTVLPWAVAETAFGTISRAGVQGDGLIILVLAAVAGVLGAVMLTRRPVPAMRIGIVAAMAIGLFIVIYDAAHLASGTTATDIQIGAGVYVTVVGSLVAAVGAVLPA